MGLSALKQRFVHEYLVDGNASQAAVRAGYSAKTAGSQGARLLKQADVAAALAVEQAVLAERNKLSANWVIERLRAVADAGLRGDSVRALEILCKVLGITRERHEVSGPDGAAIPTSLSIRFVRPPDGGAAD